MGLFDTFVPAPAMTCPACRTVFANWQGKDGPCLLLIWMQGIREAKATDLEVEIGDLTLPAEFLIYSYDCDCFVHGVEAIGRCVDRVWTSTEYMTADLIERFHYALPRAERVARIDRLRKAGL